jgi:hypothetical protein
LRIFRKVLTDVAASGDWLQAAGAEYGEWIGSPQGLLATWKSAPCSEELSCVVLRIDERLVGGTVFSVTDFERLCIIFTQDELVRSSLFKSGKNISRRELDAGVRRDDFWSTTVSPATVTLNCRSRRTLSFRHRQWWTSEKKARTSSL